MPPTPPVTQVLLLDDDPSSAGTLGVLLAESELEVEPAASPAEALGILRASQARTLVLLNLHAQAAAGPRFMESLAEDAALRARCAVVDIVRALGHGEALPARAADRVIERPLTPADLVGLIREYLGWSRG
jgi:CheY-like chemotaxis protein